MMLYWAAEFADLKMLSVLYHERLRGPCANDEWSDEFDDGLTAFDVAEKRLGEGKCKRD